MQSKKANLATFEQYMRLTMKDNAKGRDMITKSDNGLDGFLNDCCIVPRSCTQKGKRGRKKILLVVGRASVGGVWYGCSFFFEKPFSTRLND